MRKSFFKKRKEVSNEKISEGEIKSWVNFTYDTATMTFKRVVYQTQIKLLTKKMQCLDEKKAKTERIVPNSPR
jgi:hypothetical protein